MIFLPRRILTPTVNIDGVIWEDLLQFETKQRQMLAELSTLGYTSIDLNYGGATFRQWYSEQPELWKAVDSSSTPYHSVGTRVVPSNGGAWSVLTLPWVHRCHSDAASRVASLLANLLNVWRPETKQTELKIARGALCEFEMGEDYHVTSLIQATTAALEAASLPGYGVNLREPNLTLLQSVQLIRDGLPVFEDVLLDRLRGSEFVTWLRGG